MPKKESMAILNALISNEVDARARAKQRKINLSKNRVHYREYLPKKEVTHGEQAEMDLGITDHEAQAYFFPTKVGKKVAITSAKTLTATGKKFFNVKKKKPTHEEVMSSSQKLLDEINKHEAAETAKEKKKKKGKKNKL